MNSFSKVLFILIIVTSFKSYSCNTQVDEKKAVIFIDTNGSYLEAKAAKEAACARGESFVLLPKSMEEIKIDFTLSVDKKRYVKRLLKLKCFDVENSEKSECVELGNKQKVNSSKIKERKKNAIKMNKAMLNKRITDLAASDIAVTSIIASGHDGGGSIRGSNGKISKREIISVLTENYKDKPELLKSLSSVCLWGCYTSIPGEVFDWKTSLPGLKIIAGFHGSGPANDKLASHSYLKDLLIKEKVLLQKKTDRSLRKSINSLENINFTLPGLYVNGACEEEKYFHIKKTTVDNNTVFKKKFQDFNEFTKCDGEIMKSQLSNLKYKFNKYYEGKTEIPVKTSGTPLRDIYNKSRQLQHCINPNSIINPAKVGMALFYKGVSENFAKLFEKQLKVGLDHFAKFQELIDQEIESEIEKGQESLSWFDSIRGIEAVKSDRFDELLSIKEKYEQTKIYVDATKNIPVDKLSRAQVKNLLSSSDAFVNDRNLKKTFSLNAGSVQYKKSIELIDKYLYQLDPKCMDFIDWHEATSDHQATPNCY